jgi:hypothetical protein
MHILITKQEKKLVPIESIVTLFGFISKTAKSFILNVRDKIIDALVTFVHHRCLFCLSEK